jgi:hypothetical protein
MHLGNAYCRHCGDTIETTMHVLCDCPMAMMIWVRMVDLDFRNQFFNVNFDDWLHLNLNFAGSVNAGKWPELWSITCHSLWMWRNKEEHCTGFERPQQLWKQVINYAMRYMAASYVNHDEVNAKQQIMVSWTLPLSGWVKINSDGACQGGLRAGCGGLIRNVVHMLQSCGVFWRV